MAQITNTFDTYTAIGNREELADAIYNISPEETPFVSAIGKARCTSVFPEWQTDSLASASNNKVEQGNAATLASTSPTVRMGNRTQISEKVFGVTGTQEKVDKAGRRSEVAYQQAKKMVELKRDIEYAALRNTTLVAAASGVAPQARGVAGWLATNNDLGPGSTGGGGTPGAAPVISTNSAPVDADITRAFTETLLKNVAEDVWSAGGDPTMLLVPAAQRKVVSGFSGIADAVNDVKAKAATIVGTADVYVGDFGTYSIVNSRHQRDRDVFLLQPNMWDLLTLRPMKAEKLAKTGDAENYMINTEWTLKARNEAANGAIRDLS